MRNLTITRRKAFAASLMTDKVYIENHVSGDKIINEVPCTKIGELKNGETKTFPIDDYAAKVYVIIDDLSKNYCNDFYEIPQGTEDVFLSGENKLNPAIGNAFRFDGISGEKVVNNRKKGSKKGKIVLITAIIIGAIIGFIIGIGPSLSADSQPKIFSAEGMQITLTEEFKEQSINGFTACFDSKSMAVLTLKEPFSIMDGFEDYTIDQYAELVIKNNNKNPESVKKENGLTYFEYTGLNPNNNVTYYYLTALYKAEDAFWIVTFSCSNDEQEKYKETFIDWAGNVKFTNQSA